jgi:hypothetical protein
MTKSVNPRTELKEFTFPTPVYYIARFFHNHPNFAQKMHNWESKTMRKKIDRTSINKPIFVTGFARAGTTVTVEMIGKHTDIAYHKYLTMVAPYVPNWIQKIANILPIFRKPRERVHKDTLAVNRDSPEAVEEIFWMRFFASTRKDSESNIIDSTVDNPEFEEFYKNHIKKLMINQKSTGYVAKNNYSITRMEYIKKIFPDAKFILMIRNPIDHIASLIKQDRVLGELEESDPRLLHWTKIIGHQEFGSAKIIINVANNETVEKIRKMWGDKSTYVSAWAIYWASIYKYAYDVLEKNKAIKDSTLVLRYEDFTEETEKWIDKIIDHTEISPEKFKEVQEVYKKKIKQPSYYKPSFSKSELEEIEKHTKEIASKFGY